MKTTGHHQARSPPGLWMLGGPLPLTQLNPRGTAALLFPQWTATSCTSGFG